MEGAQNPSVILLDNRTSHLTFPKQRAAPLVVPHAFDVPTEFSESWTSGHLQRTFQIQWSHTVLKTMALLHRCIQEHLQIPATCVIKWPNVSCNSMISEHKPWTRAELGRVSFLRDDSSQESRLASGYMGWRNLGALVQNTNVSKLCIKEIIDLACLGHPQCLLASKTQASPGPSNSLGTPGFGHFPYLLFLVEFSDFLVYHLSPVWVHILLYYLTMFLICFHSSP